MAATNLQTKLDRMLAVGIEDVKALGIELYGIIPSVRITNNTHRIGSAKDINKSFVKFGGKLHVAAGKTPLFRISISRQECESDYDIKNVLYHEILHCAPNCQDHQKTWKSHAAKVNAAYGLNVTTTKKETAPEFEDRPAGAVDVKQYIGKCFRDGKRTFKFTGFNARPKNKCDIVDVKTGKQFVCAPDYVARQMANDPCLFGASISAQKPDTANATASERSRFSELVGKKVKNGPRGRKIFTVISIDPGAGSKAVILNDESGNEYYGKIGCASRLVVVG